jgi:hypothetical protein
MRRTAPLLLLLCSVNACAGTDSSSSTGAPLVVGADATFSRIQRDILDPQCAGCHTSGNTNAKQSGLVLTADSSYQQLVGIASVQGLAKSVGLLRIKAFKSDSSLFYHKLAWIPGHHSVDYGNLMPMGTTQGVTAGQLEYIRRWIDAGAPRTGNVADTTVLADTRVQSATFSALAAPTTGGLQLKVDSFAVTPSRERELFVYRALGNAADLYVTRIQSRMRPGSHHLLLYTFDETNTSFPCDSRPAHDAVRDIKNQDGTFNLGNVLPMACHVFFAGAMTPEFDYSFPPGVALRLPANASLDLNVHYVNRSPANLPGEAYANLYTTDRARVQTVARTLNYTNTNIYLAAGQRATLTKFFPVSVRTTVLGVTSHMHSLGEKFEIRVRRANGSVTTIYTNTDWEHPGFVNFVTPIVLEPGDGLESVVTWNNTTARLVTFGLASTNEMDIIFGYAY